MTRSCPRHRDQSRKPAITVRERENWEHKTRQEAKWLPEEGWQQFRHGEAGARKGCRRSIRLGNDPSAGATFSVTAVVLVEAKAHRERDAVDDSEYRKAK